MHGPLRIVLALLLVAAPVAAVPLVDTGGATAAFEPAVLQTDDETPRADSLPPVVQTANTSARLALPDDRIERVRFGSVTLDVGAALSRDNTRIHGRYDTIRLRESFAEAGDDTDERRAVVVDTADRFDARIDALAARERAALAAYNDGEMSTRAYLRELVTISASAEALSTTLDQLYTFNRAAGMPVEATRVARMKARLVPLTGPVRSTLANAMAGESDRPTRVYVETSESGFVLSMLQQGQFTTEYVREAYFGAGLDERWSDRPISFDEFDSRLGELYPWVYSTDPGVNTVLTSVPYYERAGVYGISLDHPHGTNSARDLLVYYDAGTQNVFYEVQRLDTNELPDRQLATATDDNLRIEVRGLYADGPLWVNVTDATTGESVDATVALNGNTLGTTDEDDLMTIAPRGTFSVTASYRGGNVSTTVANFK